MRISWQKMHSNGLKKVAKIQQFEAFEIIWVLT